MHCNDKTELPRLTPDELLCFLQKFGTLSAYYQCAIFYLVIKNHLFGSREERGYQEYCKLVRQLFFVLDNKSKFCAIIDAFLDNQKVAKTSPNQMLDAVNNCMRKKGDLFNKTLMFNNLLFKSDLCPLLCYAFGSWQISPELTKDNLLNIIELTIMYMYRIVPNKTENMDKLSFVNKGGVFNVCILENQKQVLKYPKNYAAKAFLAQQESDSYRYFAKNPEMKPFLPNFYTFDTERKIIAHTFINGISGDDILEMGGQLNEKQKSELAKFYNIYMKYPEMRFLDVHPGNFVWEPNLKRWFFIDLGLIPYIGSDYYYKWDSFEKYYHHVWGTRLWQKKNIPVRSLDYALADI